MISLNDIGLRENFFPFTHTRHLADIRIGILTIKEKWELLTGERVSFNDTTRAGIDANILPTKNNFEEILQWSAANKKNGNLFPVLNAAPDIFKMNDQAIRSDFELITARRDSIEISTTNRLINADYIFIEQGARVEHSILNASTGPIYIGKNAEIMEGNLIRGPFAAGEGSVVKMGSTIYGATTLGPFCTAGGEIKNSVLFGYSNKAHHGYLGDSVIGEWCNIGAGTSNSNVKNTAGAVSFKTSRGMPGFSSGNKGGLLMGDYTRSAINTSFNTGSVTGACCNIFGNNSPETFIENFSWGTERYQFEKAIRDISNWKKMKNQTVSNEEISMLKKLYDHTFQLNT